MYRFLAASAAFFMLAGSAFAQVDPNPVLRDVVAPIAVSTLSAIASVVLGLGYAWLQRKWGLEIEANHRAALHSAIQSGIQLAIRKTTELGKLPNIPVTGLNRIALEYVLRSVPDAIRQFDLSEERIEQMIQAKIPQIIGQTPSTVSPPVSAG